MYRSIKRSMLVVVVYYVGMFGSFFFSAHILNSLLVGLAGGDVAHRPVFKVRKNYHSHQTEFESACQSFVILRKGLGLNNLIGQEKGGSGLIE